MTTRSNFLSTNSLFYSNDSTGTNGQYEVVDGVTRTKWNNYTASFHREVRTPGRSTALPTFDQWWDCTSTVGSIMTSNDELTLQSRLSETVKGHQFNLAVSAAQGKQTVDMVVNVEAGILDPVRFIEHQRDLLRATFEDRQ